MNIPSYFEEEAYLYYNPDVAEAVANGAVESGYHHWLFYGQGEPRLGAPWRYAADRRVFVSRFENRPFGVNLFGFLSTPSGLGEAARSSRTALGVAGIPTREIDVPGWHLPNAPRIAPSPDERYRVNLIHQNADMMQPFLRAYGEEVFHGAYNIPFWFWELPAMLPEWFPYYEYADEIWVASEFCRRSIASMTRLPVVRMPLVIEGLEKRLRYNRAHFGLPESTFLFGYAYDVNSYLERKNPVALVEAFRREFGDSTDVLLVLKQSYGGSTRNPEGERVRDAVAGARNITILDREFADYEITSFQNSLDCFVSPHRAEGFGFNLAESMYLRKPVIATGYSGNVDFMNEENSYSVNYRIVPIERTMGPYRKGLRWAEPDIAHLAHQMRRVWKDRAERDRKATAAASTIRRDYSSLEAARRMRSRCEELGLDQPHVRRHLFSGHSLRGAPRFLHPDTPPEVREEIRRMEVKPLISVLLNVQDVSINNLRLYVASVQRQFYPYWQLCICHEDSMAAETVAALDEYAGTDARITVTRHGITGDVARGDYLVAQLHEMVTPEFLLDIAKQSTSSTAATLDARP